MISDPDLGFSGLSAFGSTFVNHAKLKVRKNLNNKDYMIIDTPGMIDSSLNNSQVANPSGDARGYDFTSVCRWFAERSDLILLFFDPDKPG